MKPGTIKTDLPTGQVLLDHANPTQAVGEVEGINPTRIDIESLPDGGTQFPPGESSTTKGQRDSALVRGRVQISPEIRRGRRQKLMKVLDVKTLSKAARQSVRLLSQVLDQGVQKLRQRRDAKSEFFASEDA